MPSFLLLYCIDNKIFEEYNLNCKQVIRFYMEGWL